MVTIDGSGYPSYPRPFWEATRPVPDNVSNGSSFLTAEAPARSSPPSTVARALREQCNIDFESFLLVAYLGNGKFAYFSGPQALSEEEIRKIFRRDKFLQAQNKTSSRESCSQPNDSGYDDMFGRGYSDRHGRSGIDGGMSLPGVRWPSRPRRRPGANISRRELDNDEPAVITSAKRAIQINDSEQVWEFYDHRFKCVQQTACKLIAKAFVKTIAPKKQANNPYIKGDAMAPSWWPKPWGPGPKDKVRHVEPDHQWKKERVHLLKHILRLVIEQKHPDIQKLGVNIAKLESAAMEMLSPWFSDRDNVNNAKKLPIVKEIFKVAKAEEKYRRNEIDGSTIVYVKADDMVMGYYQSDDDDDDDDDDGSGRLSVKEERDPAHSRGSSRTISPTSTTTMPHNLLPTLPLANGSNPAVTAQVQDAPFMSHQYAGPAMMAAELAPESYSYAGGGSLAAADGQPSLQVHTTAALQMEGILSSAHHHQDPTGRRSSSVFSSPTTFSGPSPSSLYASPWQQQQQQQQQHQQHHCGTTAPGNAPLYAFPTASNHHQHQHPQQHHHHPQTPPSLPLPQDHHQHHHHQQAVTAAHYAAAAATGGVTYDGFRGSGSGWSVGLPMNHPDHHHQQQQHREYAGYFGHQSVKVEAAAAGGGGSGGGNGGEGDCEMSG